MEDLSLGKALAILETYPDCCKHLPPAFLPWHGFLHTLRERRDQLQTDSDIISKTFRAIPEQGCEEVRPLLYENSDFFLVYILIAPHAKTRSGECMRLFQHLNGCYLCFEEYSPVFRDYYHMSQDLHGLGGSVTATSEN